MQVQLKGVQQIQASQQAFAAILSNGSVVSWGARTFGGDSRVVQDQLKSRACSRSKPPLGLLQPSCQSCLTAQFFLGAASTAVVTVVLWMSS